jgi:hypothetical protein
MTDNPDRAPDETLRETFGRALRRGRETRAEHVADGGGRRRSQTEPGYVSHAVVGRGVFTSISPGSLLNPHFAGDLRSESRRRPFGCSEIRANQQAVAVADPDSSCWPGQTLLYRGMHYEISVKSPELGGYLIRLDRARHRV